ncbi:MAG TPA: response regulator transcription factor, partial [Terriglobales bacterium]|nr:response regulator transcription factor [Terriglobales bacterium]
MPDAPVIFVVNAERERAIGLARQLAAGGFRTLLLEDGSSALSEAAAHPASLFILGRQLADGDGLQLCRRLRETSGSMRTPILFVARASESERVSGLEAGADDFLNEPSSPRELVARVRALLRRYETAPRQEILRVGGLCIDRLAMTVTVDGREAALTVTEFRLLEHLARHRGRVLSREQVLAA